MGSNLECCDSRNTTPTSSSRNLDICYKRDNSPKDSPCPTPKFLTPVKLHRIPSASSNDSSPPLSSFSSYMRAKDRPTPQKLLNPTQRNEFCLSLRRQDSVHQRDRAISKTPTLHSRISSPDSCVNRSKDESKRGSSKIVNDQFLSQFNTKGGEREGARTRKLVQRNREILKQARKIISFTSKM